MLIEEHVPVCAEPPVRLFTARSTGPADRALLVIHGGPDWDHSYLRQPLERLADTHRLVFADLRGCGRSTTGLPQQAYTPDAAVADLLALLDALRIERTDVLGFSYGGLLAQRLALAAPHRIRRLIIASSSIPPVPDNAYEHWPEVAQLQATGNAVWADDPEPSPELVRADALAGIPANIWRPEACPEYRRRLEQVRFTAEWTRPYLDGALPPARPQNSVERLAALGLPILLLHGRQDMTFPATLAEQSAAVIPHAHVAILDQAGHMTHIDQPEAWLDAISTFLD
ncbi:alpha/beta hydrolase [Actinocrinis puniceicyclus]|uniref:Alpha/beta hydrolase n=1 Tax=Actinocrinis puniceicyclus TaxID=977794 RepID=A0A8J7WWX1_9ACTN|nr:alpha/beta hydrolase [Actinocrinis puniceicyclus]MBS2966589.1 alpha/beta hydrolase [Actinocrinis puniceicyclus]